MIAQNLFSLTTVLVLMFGVANAATTGETTSKLDIEPKNMSVVSKGFTVSIIKDFMDAKFKAAGRSVSLDADQSIGLGLGYSDVVAYDIGFTTRIVYNTYDSGGDGDDGKLIRVDGNAAYGLSSKTFAYGGLNISQLVDIEESDGLSADPRVGLGLQFGVGHQLTSNLGIQFGYGLLENKIRISDSSDSVNVGVEFDGLELALTGTF